MQCACSVYAVHMQCMCSLAPLRRGCGTHLPFLVFHHLGEARLAPRHTRLALRQERFRRARGALQLSRHARLVRVVIW